ncbi:anti-sigma factor [Kaistia terrae]|uniref:Anti-sigma factor domain-containing protein n=1 Tax=Kaistia terrae TaxID=537017 RepID=A0ABW0PZ49_9HYPH|nr:anti-sigma factor [Kaistia terrae]MCX5580334.1 anti-sigma factor [Kaistia terrae]
MSRDEQMAKAGRFVLGLMEGLEAQSFEAEMQADPALAAMVGKLAKTMQALDDTAEPAAIPKRMWDKIETRIAALPQEAPVAAGNVVAFDRAGGKPRRTVSPWRFAAMAATAVLALGLGYLAGARLAAPPEPVAFAVLLNESDAMPGAIVQAYADDSVMLRPLRGFDVPDGKILQVWTLPDRETGPVSLGTLSRQAATRLQGPDLPLPHEGQLYEITLEPSPGSPTGRPTGPILVKGYARFSPSS